MPEIQENNHQKLKDWFSQCIEDNMGTLYAVAVRLTKNETDAEDLVAEAVTRAWVALNTLQDKTRFRPWIICIQRNIFISQYRKKKRRPEESPFKEDPTSGCSDHEIASLLNEQSDEFLNWWANPEREFVNNLLGEEIQRAIEKLPEVFQETILLVNVEGFSYDEAAQVLGVSPGTIRSRMNRGRTILQKCLWQHANDAGLISDRTMMEISA